MSAAEIATVMFPKPFMIGLRCSWRTEWSSEEMELEHCELDLSLVYAALPKSPTFAILLGFLSEEQSAFC